MEPVSYKYKIKNKTVLLYTGLYIIPWQITIKSLDSNNAIDGNIGHADSDQ